MNSVLLSRPPLLDLRENILHGLHRVGRSGLEDAIAVVIRIAGQRHLAKETVAITVCPPRLEQIIGRPEIAKPMLHSAELDRAAVGTVRLIRRSAARCICQLRIGQPIWRAGGYRRRGRKAMSINTARSVAIDRIIKGRL